MKCNLCKIITFRVKLDNKLISLAQRHSEYKDESLLNFFVKFRNMRTRKTDQITNIFTFGRVTKRFSQKPLSLSESLLSTIEPIEHQVYQPSSLLTIEPNDHQAYRPSSLLTIKPILLTSGLLLQLISLPAC